MLIAALMAAATLASPNACFRDREVSITAPATNSVIGGSLSAPPGPGRRPAVLMITGSGPQTRDQMISGLPMFKAIGDHLAAEGFVVLRTDSRGQGASTGQKDWHQTTSADRLADTVAALTYLRAQPEVDPDQVVVFGHSEGADIAVELAALGTRVKSLVVVGLPATRGDVSFIEQRTLPFREKGRTEIADAITPQLARFTAYANSNDENPKRLDSIIHEFYLANGDAEPGLTETVVREFMTNVLSWPYYRYRLQYDPAPSLGKIQVPVLAIWGGGDEQAPWRSNLQALTRALNPAARLTAIIIPREDHFLMELDGKPGVSHVFQKMSVAPALLATLDKQLSVEFTLHPCTP